MPIKYKVIEKGLSGVKGGGTKKYYASPNMSGELSLEELTKTIEKISTVEWCRHSHSTVCLGRCDGWSFNRGANRLFG